MSKVNAFLQFDSNETNLIEVEKEIKRIWREDKGYLIKDIKKLNMYLKPEEGRCYYVINNKHEGIVNL
ncbi:DUF6465 family protein [Peptostreptococcaceae bacterium AGR-M142]